MAEKIINADTLEELDKKIKTEIVEQGWNTDGQVINEPDGSFSQKLTKIDSES